MTQNEKELASKMLEKLGKILGIRSCNDFEFPDSWSNEDKLKFVKEYHDWNGDPEEFSEDYLRLPDFAIAGFLADKIKAA